jgi:hypothetical protein
MMLNTCWNCRRHFFFFTRRKKKKGSNYLKFELSKIGINEWNAKKSTEIVLLNYRVNYTPHSLFTLHFLFYTSFIDALYSSRYNKAFFMLQYSHVKYKSRGCRHSKGFYPIFRIAFFRAAPLVHQTLHKDG